MDKQRWALPVALTALVVAACGVSDQRAGSTPPVVTSGTTMVPSSALTSATPGSTSGPQGALHADLDCPGDEATNYTYSLASMPPRPEPYGASTPEGAANSPGFGLQPEFRGDGTAWTTVAADSGSVTLGQGSHLRVDVIKLPDGSWYVISGQRCTTQP